MSDLPTINGVPIDRIPVRAADTGIPIKRLAGFVLRNGIDDPIGGLIGSEAVIYNDWRLRELQEREGVPPLPEPAELVVVPVPLAESQI
jgi:hypothetical protein